MNQLTPVQTEFLRILKAFMRNKAYQLPDEFSDLPALYKMAAEHHMTAAVYEMIHKSSICQNGESTSFMAMWKRSTIMAVMQQVQRTEGFFHVYDKLCKQGVKPLVVKGIICRNMYANPDARISGDEDMLIRKEDYVLCHKILLEEGFERGGTEEEIDPSNLPHEIPYHNRKNGTYIELHLSLFPEESGAYGHLNEEFENVFKRCICEKAQGRDIWTLGPTDHMFYLICHSFKHFLHGGFGLRQVCDMVLMAEKYGSQIDWITIGEKVERLNMAKYWDSLVKIGQRYLGFSVEKAAYPIENDREKSDVSSDYISDTIDYGPMLMDLLDSGIYGNSTMERKHSANMTLAAVVSGKKDTTGSILASLFPGTDYMKSQFQWLNRYPWLLPVAYGIRIMRYLKKSGSRDKGEQSSIQIGMERVELLRKYGIIE